MRLSLVLRTVCIASLLIAPVMHAQQPTPSVTSSDTLLAPCPGTPNCVSTEATRESQRVPTVPFTDAPDAALARAKAALLAESRSKITAERGLHLHGECRSFLFRFVDDVDIVVDSAARVFRFRSASRVGRGDMGVNRKRIARIAERLQK